LVILLALHVLSRPVLFGNGNGQGQNHGNGPKKIAAIQIEGAGDTSSGNGLPIGKSSIQDTNGSMVQYYGGPLIQNIAVILVLVQKVTSTTHNGKTTYTVTPVNYASKLPDFYQTLVASVPYMNFLSTFSAGGYTIGTGTFVGTLPYNWTTNVVQLTDAQIQTKISQDILLKAANQWTFNTANVYFAMHWAPGFNINQSNTYNCVQWCAYHGTTTANITYGVLPDFGGNQACRGGCNCYYSGYCNHTNPYDYFSATTVVASHEFAETITDPDVGIATSWGPPLGWADINTGAEIGDNCNQLPALLENKYWTQRLASNINNACYPIPIPTTQKWAVWS